MSIVSSVKFALCQLKVGADKAANLVRARTMIQKAVAAKADIVMLPEIFNSPYSTDSFGPYSEVLPDKETGFNGFDFSKSPSVEMIFNTAKESRVYLIAGSIPEQVTEGKSTKYYNTSLVLNPEGELIAKHRKVHLFDIDVPNGITFKESDTLSAGNEITMFDTPFARIGLGICYDMRFAQYAQVCADEGATIMCYPGAFNTTTGPAHWELLQRGRAVDNQMFVVTCSPSRNPESAYQAWGHSSVVDPWGTVLATTEHEEDLVVADLDLTNVTSIREQIPVRVQRRDDMYSVIRKHASDNKKRKHDD